MFPSLVIDLALLPPACLPACLLSLFRVCCVPTWLPACLRLCSRTASQVTSVEAALDLMEDGLKGRATASTNLNEHSSRSHSIFTIYVETLDSKSGSVKQAQLNLVDLAGSESTKRSGTSGIRLEEGE